MSQIGQILVADASTMTNSRATTQVTPPQWLSFSYFENKDHTYFKGYKYEMNEFGYSA